MTFPQELPDDLSPQEAAEVQIAERIKGYVLDALRALPAQYFQKIENVQFFVRRDVGLDDSQRLRVRQGHLYGLYEGIPLTRRGDGYNFVMPDRITIYWGPLLRDFPEEALADQVQKVVYHEIGHYFGMSEADLHQTRMH